MRCARGHARARCQHSSNHCRYGLRVSEPRARSPIAADHRSALPNVPGIPWWGAAVLAVTLAAVGFAFDAGSGGKTLTAVFAVCYAAGCVIAVLAVRQSGVFTAVIQPPLVLFFIVPGAHFVLTGGQVKGIKDVLINCGYPLIERFPLMFFTSGTVLLIGMVRWYFSASSQWAKRTDTVAGDVADTTADARLAASAMAMKSATEVPRRSRRNATARADRATTVQTEEPRRKPARTTASPSRSRHNRPPDTELVEPPERRPGRPRSAPPAEEPIEPRRRTRPTPPHESRRTPPPEDRRTPYDRPKRPERSEHPERPERPVRAERAGRGDRRQRVSDYDAYEGRPSGGSSTRNGAGGSHHPVSRVRYRADDGEPQPQQRSRPRRPRDSDADSGDFGR